MNHLPAVDLKRPEPEPRRGWGILNKIMVEGAIPIHGNVKHMRDALPPPQIHGGYNGKKNSKNPPKVHAHCFGIAVPVSKNHSLGHLINFIWSTQCLHDIVERVFSRIEPLECFGRDWGVDDNPAKITPGSPECDQYHPDTEVPDLSHQYRLIPQTARLGIPNCRYDCQTPLPEQFPGN